MEKNILNIHMHTHSFSGSCECLSCVGRRAINYTYCLMINVCVCVCVCVCVHVCVCVVRAGEATQSNHTYGFWANFILSGSRRVARNGGPQTVRDREGQRLVFHTTDDLQLRFMD